MIQSEQLRNYANNLTRHVITHSKPDDAHYKIIKGKDPVLFLPNGSQTVNLDHQIEDMVNEVLASKNNQDIEVTLSQLGISLKQKTEYPYLQDQPIYALSLAIAQKCNLGCTYCYAEQGSFGSPTKNMTLETALEAIDFLFEGKQPGDKVNISFMGGEPLINRKDIQTATRYAVELSEKTAVKVNFSITSNGTLINSEDIEFFEKYGFAVTISLDGIGASHDQLRPFKNGKGTYDFILKRIEPLLSQQKKMQVSARVTVTPRNMDLPKVLDEFINMGFHSVGFSPLLNSINGQDEMSKEDLDHLLQEMIMCGLQFETAVMQGKRYPFLNMVNALKEISNHTNRPYPCGAGAGYMAVSADGELAACHRFVNEPNGYMGDVSAGVNHEIQNSWLKDRHVENQSPCTECWARYLCGGGCHHEVIDKGRVACDFIRGWLYYTIQAHTRISKINPNWNRQ